MKMKKSKLQKSVMIIGTLVMLLSLALVSSPVSAAASHTVAVSVSDSLIRVGEYIQLTVTDTNTGDQPLYCVSVDVNNGTTDIATDLGRATAVASIKPGWTGTTPNLTDNVLAPGEVWTWTYLVSGQIMNAGLNYQVNGATTFTATSTAYTNSMCTTPLAPVTGTYQITPVVVDACSEVELYASADGEIWEPLKLYTYCDEDMDSVWLRVTEDNCSEDEDLYNVQVCINPTTGACLTRASVYFVSGDEPFGEVGYGILEPDEIWVWERQVPLVNGGDTVFTATGFGYDWTGYEVTHPEYPERDQVTVDVICPNTLIDIEASPTVVEDPGTTTLTINETNTGDDPLTAVSVYVQAVAAITGDGYTEGDLIDEWTLGTADVVDSSGLGLTLAQLSDDILQPGETWQFVIADVAVDTETIYIAVGSGTDSAGGLVTYSKYEDPENPGEYIIEFPTERDRVTVGYYEYGVPDSTVTIKATPDADADEECYYVGIEYLTIYAGATVDLTVTETNTGLDPLTGVWVCVVPQVGCQLTKSSQYYVGGDNNNDGILNEGEPGVKAGETWTWIIPDVVVDQDTTFTATGHGFDSKGNDVTYPDYNCERATVHVNTIDPDTKVTITSSDDAVNVGGLVDLTITEENTGDDRLDAFTVEVIVDKTTSEETVQSVYVLRYWLFDVGGYYAGGDVNSNYYLDPGETFTWVIPDVQIDEDVTYTATGSALDSLGNPVTYSENAADQCCDRAYPDEQDSVDIEILGHHPDTVLTLCVTPDSGLSKGDEVGVLITEENTGDAPLGSVWVWLGMIKKATAEHIPGYRLVVNDIYYVEGDVNENEILDPGEMWTWIIPEIEVETNTIFIAKGHGVDALCGDVTYPEFKSERDRVDLVVGTDANSLVTIQTCCPDEGTTIQVGDKVNLRITEENIGQSALTDVEVVVSGGTLDITLDKDHKYYVSGDMNDDGILDVDETWTWIVPDIEVDVDTTFTATGDGIDSVGNHITYPEYPDEQASVDITVI